MQNMKGAVKPNKIVFYVLAGMMYLGVPAQARAANPSAKMTCQEFIQLEDANRPKVMYWFNGYVGQGNSGKNINFERDEKLLPILVEECLKTPKRLYVEVVKAVQRNIASENR